ncbi:MAG: type II toxin-antitoxin system PemK/MazF family toxin [Pseudomonadota bacterium]
MSGARPPAIPPKIVGAPKIRQFYWCEFWQDAILSEMWKTRPVLIVSYRNTLYGPCSVLPVSTDPQEGKSADWAHRLSFSLDGHSENWVVCNHIYTVSPRRLSPFRGVPPRMQEGEFNDVLKRLFRWLPRLPSEPVS